MPTFDDEAVAVLTLHPGMSGAAVDALLAPPGVRGLVLELARPAEWPPMARLWQGVQADLGWPAPAIVVNGVDGYQLWFSLAAPMAMRMLPAFSRMVREPLSDSAAPQKPAGSGCSAVAPRSSW